MENPAPSNKRFKVYLLISLSSFILVVGLFFWWFEARKTVWTNDAYIEGYTVSLSADIEARIMELFVDEGDFVKCGDPICILDRSIFDARKNEAITNVYLLQNRVETAKIFMEKLRDDYVIAKQEFENGIISFLDFDHNEKDYKMAESQLQTAQAELKNAEAQLDLILAWLKHTTVYAPMSGKIAKRWIFTGDVAHIGQPLFELNHLDNVWVTAKLEETKMQGVKIGAPVKIHVDAYPGEEFSGRVFVIKSAAASQFALIPPENATGNFTKVVQRIPIKIHIDVPKDKPYYLFPGMSCEVKIEVR